jgi:hypothetical protein
MMTKDGVFIVLSLQENAAKNDIKYQVFLTAFWPCFGMREILVRLNLGC